MNAVQIINSAVPFVQTHSVGIVSFVALALSLSGSTLINFRRRAGFFVWIASNVTWIVVNLMGTPNWSQIAMFVVYMAMNVHGWVSWGKDETER